MIMYSIRARIIGNPAEALTWAQEVSQLASKLGGAQVQVSARVGGHQDLVWVSQHESMAALDTALGKIQQDSTYQAMIKSVMDKKLFEPGETESAIWRTL